MRSDESVCKLGTVYMVNTEVGLLRGVCCHSDACPRDIPPTDEIEAVLSKE